MLAGKTVLIFGGSSGMGKATAKCVLAAGGTPYIIGRTLEKLTLAQQEISPADPSLIKVASVDCFSKSEVSAFFENQAASSYHHIVCTIGASAGCSDIRGPSNFVKLKAQFDNKFFSQLLPVSYGADKIADNGSIVLTSGALARRPEKGSSALGAANAALEAIVKGLANDFGPRVRVNCVSPGLTDTEMWDKMPPERKVAMLEGFASSLPLKRVAESMDIGRGIFFLLTNDYITGATIDIDGGAVIK